MSNISEHYSKLDGEHSDEVYGWIYLSVSWNTICIYYFLEWGSEFVCFEEGGGDLIISSGNLYDLSLFKTWV